jgi:hypothetical protein
MTTIRVRIDPDSITLDDMEAIEALQDTANSWIKMKLMLQRFLVDEQNQPLPEADAAQLVGKLSITQAKTAMDQFRQAMDLLSAEALPNATGSS